MILFLNGPFGVGKTTCARMLRKRVPRSIILDPERIGFVLQRLTRSSDYQDLKLWRRLTLASIRLTRLLFPTVIVPMTVWREDYRAELTRGMKRIDPHTIALTLTATKGTHVERIRSRTPRSAVQWSLAHLDRSLDAFTREHGSQCIATDGKTAEEVVCDILKVVRAPAL